MITDDSRMDKLSKQFDALLDKVMDADCDYKKEFLEELISSIRWKIQELGNEY